MQSLMDSLNRRLRTPNFHYSVMPKPNWRFVCLFSCFRILFLIQEKFAKQVTVTNGETGEKTVGVPNFWAKVLHNIEITNDMIEVCCI
jgi:hypothetical protein